MEYLPTPNKADEGSAAAPREHQDGGRFGTPAALKRGAAARWVRRAQTACAAAISTRRFRFRLIRLIRNQQFAISAASFAPCMCRVSPQYTACSCRQCNGTPEVQLHGVLVFGHSAAGGGNGRSGRTAYADGASRLVDWLLHTHAPMPLASRDQKHLKILSSSMYAEDANGRTCTQWSTHGLHLNPL